MKLKFNIGDFIISELSTQWYIVVDIDEEKRAYVCIDALCGRTGLVGVLFDPMPGFASADGFEKHSAEETKDMTPTIAKEYCEKYKLPAEWGV